MTRMLGGVLIAVALAAAGCSGGGSKPAPKNNDTTTGTSAGPGLGGSTAAPTGTAWAKPAELTIASAPAAFDATWDGSCAAADTDGRVYGGTSYAYVNVCLGLYSATSITVTLPPGLILVASDVGTQNGLVLRTVEIPVPGGTWTYVVVRLFCVNAHRSGAWYSDPFTVGPVTNNAALLELASLVASKNLDATIPAGSMPGGYADYEGSSGHDFVQILVWKITDDGLALTDADRAALAALP